MNYNLVETIRNYDHQGAYYSNIKGQTRQRNEGASYSKGPTYDKGLMSIHDLRMPYGVYVGDGRYLLGAETELAISQRNHYTDLAGYS